MTTKLESQVDATPGIINLPNPVNSGDAVPLGYAEDSFMLQSTAKIEVTSPEYGAVVDGFLGYTGSIANGWGIYAGQAVLTDTYGGFTPYYVGKKIFVPFGDGITGVGVTGLGITTTILDYVNGTQYVLAAPYSSFTTPVVYNSYFMGTDDTTAWQNAINALNTMAVPPAVNGGLISCAKGGYTCIFGAVQTGATFHGYTPEYQICFPSHAVTPQGRLTITIEGPVTSANTFRNDNYGQTTAGLSFLSNASSGNVFDCIPIITTGTRQASSDQSINFRNCNILLPPNPQAGGLNVSVAYSSVCDNFGVDTQNFGDGYVVPTGSTGTSTPVVAGIILPGVGNGNRVALEHVYVQGFPVNVVVGEHAVFDDVTLSSCLVGMSVVGGVTEHLITLQSVSMGEPFIAIQALSAGCNVGGKVQYGGGSIRGQIDIEQNTGSVSGGFVSGYAPTNVVDDSGDLLYGRLSVLGTTAGSGNATGLIVNGGYNLNISNIYNGDNDSYNNPAVVDNFSRMYDATSSNPCYPCLGTTDGSSHLWEKITGDWETVNSAGTWSASSAATVNKLINLHNSTYSCSTAYTAPTAYSSGTTYALGAFVYSTTHAYVSVQNGNTGESLTNPTWWVEITPAPQYVLATLYTVGQTVWYAGATYVCIINLPVSIVPSNPSYWRLVTTYWEMVSNSTTYAQSISGTGGAFVCRWYDNVNGASNQSRQMTAEFLPAATYDFGVVMAYGGPPIGGSGENYLIVEFDSADGKVKLKKSLGGAGPYLMDSATSGITAQEGQIVKVVVADTGILGVLPTVTVWAADIYAPTGLQQILQYTLDEAEQQQFMFSQILKRDGVWSSSSDLGTTCSSFQTSPCLGNLPTPPNNMGTWLRGDSSWAQLFNTAAVQTGGATYDGNPYDYVPCDVSGGSVTINLPDGPANATLFGAKIVVAPGSSADTVTINSQGSDVINVTGGSTSTTLKYLFQGAVFLYDAGIWFIVSTDVPLGNTPLSALGAPTATLSIGSQVLNNVAGILGTYTRVAAGSSWSIPVSMRGQWIRLRVTAPGSGGGGAGSASSALAQAGGGAGSAGLVIDQMVQLNASDTSLTITCPTTGGSGGSGGNSGGHSGVAGGIGSSAVSVVGNVSATVYCSITPNLYGGSGQPSGSNTTSVGSAAIYGNNQNSTTRTNLTPGSGGPGGQAGLPSIPNGGVQGGGGGGAATTTVGGTGGAAGSTTTPNGAAAGVSGGNTGSTAGTQGGDATSPGCGGGGGGGGAWNGGTGPGAGGRGGNGGGALVEIWAMS